MPRRRPLQGAVPALLLAGLLAACAPALSAAPATATVEADSGTGSGGDPTGTEGPAPGTPPAPGSPQEAAAHPASGSVVLADASSGASTAPAGSGASPNTVLADAAPAAGDAARTVPDPAANVQEGIASWYGPHFAGRLTSNGEVFDPSKLTAAHRTLPFGTLVKVTNLVNGESVVVRINDRGPFKPNRIIDLSEGAAKAIGMVRMGVARVRLEPLSLPDGVVRLGVSAKLRGYEVLSRFHKVGQLLLLSKRNGADPVVVRVVGTEVPPESGADVLVASDLYARIGAQAHVQDR